MVATILKVLGQEATVGTGGSNFNGGTLIRVYNPDGSDKTVTIKDASANVPGSFTLGKNETAYVKKMPAESIFGSADLKMVQVAF